MIRARFRTAWEEMAQNVDGHIRRGHPDRPADTWLLRVLNAELDTWFDPGHPRGALLAELTQAHPEAAVALLEAISRRDIAPEMPGTVAMWNQLRRRGWLFAFVTAVVAGCLLLMHLPLAGLDSAVLGAAAALLVTRLLAGLRQRVLLNDIAEEYQRHLYDAGRRLEVFIPEEPST